MSKLIKRSSKIYDPIEKKFIDIKSTYGKKIQQYNEHCNKCPNDKIYNINTGKCVDKSSAYAKKNFKFEIEYCEALNSSKAVNDRILNNIFNIKIPGKLLKNKSTLKIKDILPEGNYKFDLASKLNIKNLKLKEYVNYIPILLFIIFQLRSLSPEISGYIIKKVKNVLKLGEDNLVSKYLKLCTDYIVSPILVDIISKLSISKFIEYISGVIVIISNLPRRFYNKSTIRRVSEVNLTKSDIPFTINPDNIKESVIKRKNIKLDENDIRNIEEFNAYNKTSSELNLSKLGINTQQIHNIKKMKFKYDDNITQPYLQILDNTYPSPIRWIVLYSQKERKNLYNKLNKNIDELSQSLRDKSDKLRDIRRNNINYKKLEKLEEKLRNSKSILEDEKRTTKKYRDIMNDIDEYKKKIKDIRLSLPDDYVPPNEKVLTALDDKLNKVTSWQTEIRKLKNTINTSINESNFNYYYPEIDKVYKSGIDFINSENITVDQPINLPVGLPPTLESGIKSVLPVSDKIINDPIILNSNKSINETVGRTIKKDPIRYKRRYNFKKNFDILSIDELQELIKVERSKGINMDKNKLRSLEDELLNRISKEVDNEKKKEETDSDEDIFYELN